MSPCLGGSSSATDVRKTGWLARQLYDVLVKHFPAEHVFKDVNNIDPGDFVELITVAVASCSRDRAWGL
jgi:hypothetical protein